MTKKYLFLWVKLFPICFILIMLSVFLLNKLNHTNIKDSENKTSELLTISELKDRLGHEYAIRLMDCKYAGDDWKRKCDKHILSEYTNQLKESDQEQYHDGVIIIYVIYFLLSLSINSQLTLLVISRKGNDNLNYDGISDWSINSAPILGVLGTVISFSLLVGSSNHNDIQDVFIGSFFNAAITTIIGGFVYILNLFMNIFIIRQ